MQTPPPFQGFEGPRATPPKPKSNVLVIVLAVFGVLLLCCGLPLGVITYFGFKFGGAAMGMAECAINLEGLDQALRKYVEANDGKLPKGDNWQKEVGKYLAFDKETKDQPIFKLWSSEGEWSCGKNSKTGFAFNDAWAGKKLSDAIAKGKNEVLIFETSSVAYNKHEVYKALPYDKSPMALEGALDERRGWAVITAGAGMGFVDKSGNVSADKKFSGSSKGLKIQTTSGGSGE